MLQFVTSYVYVVVTLLLLRMLRMFALKRTQPHQLSVCRTLWCFRTQIHLVFFFFFTLFAYLYEYFEQTLLTSLINSIRQLCPLLQFYQYPCDQMKLKFYWIKFVKWNLYANSCCARYPFVPELTFFCIIIAQFSCSAFRSPVLVEVLPIWLSSVLSVGFRC